MIILRKIKASALQFAILVSVMVALLLGSFLTLTHTHRYFKSQSNFLLSAINLSNQGIQESLRSNFELRDSTKVSVDNGEISLAKGILGGFIKIHSEGNVRAKSFEKIAITGTIPTNERTSIYVADNELPLVLVGNTRLEGNAFVSDKGIKSGSMGGNYYSGKELVYNGNIQRSRGGLPKLDQVWKQRIVGLVNYFPESVNIVRAEPENKNSFKEKPRFVYSKTNLFISESFQGNFVFKSEKSIVILPQAQLTDVTLIAPKIVIQSGFEGSLHAIASDQIVIEESSSLNYPSSLVVIGKTNTDNEQPSPKGEEPIVLRDHSIVEGICIYLDEGQHIGKRQTNTQIYISENANVKGMIYCQGNTELSGTVTGSVYTERFIANKFGSRYVNHIYNGEVLGLQLDSNMGCLPFQNMEKGVAKWLY